MSFSNFPFHFLHDTKLSQLPRKKKTTSGKQIPSNYLLLQQQQFAPGSVSGRHSLIEFANWFRTSQSISCQLALGPKRQKRVPLPFARCNLLRWFSATHCITTQTHQGRHRFPSSWPALDQLLRRRRLLGWKRSESFASRTHTHSWFANRLRIESPARSRYYVTFNSRTSRNRHDVCECVCLKVCKKVAHSSSSS